MLKQIKTGLDLLNLSKGDSITAKNLFEVVVNSKNINSDSYLDEYIINNTPQQGIHWIGDNDKPKAVIIKNTGKYLMDGSGEYALKAQKGIVNKNETANRVLIKQQEYNYPIYYLVQDRKTQNYELQEIYSVKEVKDASVILTKYEGFLSDGDIDLIEPDLSIVGEERTTIVKTRINQSIVRKNALIKYNSKCNLCGCSFESSLIASHIKGWSKSSKTEKGDIDNILLLCSNHDSLFDKHFISFDDNGLILISEEIDKENRQLLNISPDMKLQISIPSGMKKYLAIHREEFFKK